MSEEKERGPVQVELVVKTDEKKPSMWQGLRRLIAIGLAGGALVAVIGSLIARSVLAFQESPAGLEQCEGPVAQAVASSTFKLMLTQSALLAGGFVVFFIIGMFWKKKK